MNGKCRRTNSCWSRAAPRRSVSFIPKKVVNQPNPIPPLYSLPQFNDINYNNLSVDQKKLYNHFSKNFTIVQKEEEYRPDGKNTPHSIIKIFQKHFTDGTVRIRVPGVYRLMENISFKPNENEIDPFMPTAEQNVIGGLYPQNMMGPYHLGFFAAITIEIDEVILDLNGKTLSQSVEHNFQQRFYANIELANAPFITGKGPANFQGAMEYKAPNHVLVYNGKLGLSSHHGIHGNTAMNVMLYNLSIETFEVAGIALNGTITAILAKLYIQNNNTNIKILSTYSQARFIRSFLKLVSDDEKLKIQGEDKYYNDISGNLHDDLNNTFSAFKDNKPIPVSYFNNTNKGYDGNVYGIVLNVNGPVVGPFLTKQAYDNLTDPGNTDIYFETIHIYNLESHPIEIIGIKNPNGGSGAYGKKMQAGPIGDIFQIINKFVNTGGKYTGTSLSNAQVLIAKSSLSNKGTTSITTTGEINTLDWVEKQQDLGTLTSECYLVGGGDSMGHTMKGNIGFFISGGTNITGTNININGIKTNGDNVGKKLSDIHSYLDGTPIVPEIRSKLGSSAVDILCTACSNITFLQTQNNLGEPISENKGVDTLVGKIEKINESTNIIVN